MTVLEKKSKRKALAIRTLVMNGEYSPEYALNEAERLLEELIHQAQPESNQEEVIEENIVEEENIIE